MGIHSISHGLSGMRKPATESGGNLNICPRNVGVNFHGLNFADNAFPLRDEQHVREKSAFSLIGFRKVGPARSCDNSMYVFISVGANSEGGSVAFDTAGGHINLGRSGEELIEAQLRRDMVDETRQVFVPN